MEPEMLENKPERIGVTAPNLPPRKTVVKGPNDPSRPDWGIMYDSLDDPSTQTFVQRNWPSSGASPEQGAREMRGLLLKCVSSERAYEALVMKCAGRSFSNAMAADHGGGSMMEEMMGFVKSRLWNRRSDGTFTESQKGREFSSNSIIQAWEPEKGGIAKYLQVNVSNILRRDWREARMALANPNRQSIEDLAAKGRDIDSHGRIHDVTSRAAEELDATDYVEHDDAAQAESDQPRAVGFRPKRSAELEEEGGDVIDGDVASIDADDEEPSEVGLTPQRAEFEAALLPSVNTAVLSPILATSENPDYRLLAVALLEDVPDAALDRRSRTSQLRDMARRTIELTIETDGPEKDEALAALREWNPQQISFPRFFPDVVEQIRETLDMVGVERAPKQDVQLEFAVDYIEINNELARNSRAFERPPGGISEEDWQEVRHDAMGWFGVTCRNPDELDSPERPDYLALCALTDRTVDRGAHGEELAASLKTMYNDWIATSVSDVWGFGSDGRTRSLYSNNCEAITEMHDRMQAWNPLTDGFAGEVMVQHLHEIRLEQAEREAQRREAEAANLAKSEVENAARAPIIKKPAALPAYTQQPLFDDSAFAVAGPKSPPTPPTGGAAAPDPEQAF